LIDFAYDEFSQNGEDGLIERIFDVVGAGSRVCCEFGAWDGVHFSNTRKLLLNGWGGVQIEADPEKFRALTATYADRPDVHCLNRFVAAEGSDSIHSILAGLSPEPQLDFLSIDIDGDDFYVFSSIREWPPEHRPRLVVVETSTGHSPETMQALPRLVASHNIGQPIPIFCQEAEQLGYRLIAFTGNGFFLRTDSGGADEFPTLSPTAAYNQHLARLDEASREWLFRANLGRVEPYYRFRNPYLSARALGIAASKRAALLSVDAVHLPLRLRAVLRRRAT
jgi:hypothetical protein